MFPTDAITIRQQITGTGNIVLASSTRTILNISQQKENTSKNLSVNCGSNVISSLYSSINMFSQEMQYLCNGTITLSSSGSGSGVSSYILTYVNRDISITTPPPIASTTELYISGFSYGDIMIITLLIIIFTNLFFKTIKEWIFGTKIEGTINTKTLTLTRKRV
jgi:hypothetical protein